MKNKITLIVGGTSGIGLAAAKAFQANGDAVVVSGRDQAKGSEIAHEFGFDFIPCGVTDAASVAGLVDEIVDRYGRLDQAFNNAGWEGTAVPTADVDERDWLTMIDIKLNGVWRCMKAELKQMTAQGGGAIVNMAGNWGLVGFPNYASYCAAAHGIMGLTKAAALEYAGQGIRINAVCPGAVDSPMLDRMVGGDEAIKTSFGEQLAIGRICQPEEVANAVVWLCSDAASYVSGVGLPLDGGG